MTTDVDTDLASLNAKESDAELMSRLFAEISKIEIDRKRISEHLEFRRDQYCLKRYQFAALLGQSQTHYSEIINCKRDLPIESVRRAVAIGVPADVLLGINV